MAALEKKDYLRQVTELSRRKKGALDKVNYSAF